MICLAETRVFYQWLRLEQLDQWWHWVVLAAVCATIVGYVVFWYRRDSAEHTRPTGWAWMLLRLAALSGLLVFFLQLDKRSEQRVVRESRVAVLVDTSLSMTLAGTPSDIGLASSQSRSEEVAELIAESEFLSQMSARHQLSVYRFDAQNRPLLLAAFNRTADGASQSIAPEVASLEAYQLGKQLAVAAAIVGGFSLLCIAISLGSQVVGYRQWPPGGWCLLVGSALMLVSIGLFAGAVLPNTEFTLSSLFGADAERVMMTDGQRDSQATDPAGLDNSSDPNGPTDGDADGQSPKNWDLQRWAEALAPNGPETRMGDAIRAVLDREVGNPLAGVVVFTDGRSNAGVAPKQVGISAQNARVPLYFVGLGSEKSPPNVQLAEVDVARRLYPGDQFSLSALIGGSGFAGKTVTVQVSSGAKGADLREFQLDGEQQIVLPADGSLPQAKFQLEPRSVGEWQYRVQVIPPAGDAELRDNQLTVSVEVVERKNRVLILAGGPTREYQFVRNLLYRDRDVESHVFLQTATSNSSQEAQELVNEFPADRNALSQYDAVVAFDADWTQIPDASVRALEQWVAEQAGGFVLVAGSVEMPKWIARSAGGSRAQYLRSLSPVVLDARGSSLLAAGRIESPASWPLKLTPDGQQTDFLWIADDPQQSLELWSAFEGVHSYYSAYELKPGAKALALFADPTAAVDGQQPIYIASQFYGAGRTVFLGGGELWRLRQLGDEYFDRFYTKLIRWVSQSRLLLDSDRGVLLVDREEAALGDQVTVRAVLKNEQYEPLIQSEVVARLIDAQGRNVPMVLRPLADGSQPGVYTGQFPVLVAGEYNVQLQLGGLTSDEVLNAIVRARVPASEMQQSERNDSLLVQLATETGGGYWTGTDGIMLPAEVPAELPIAESFADEARGEVVAGTNGDAPAAGGDGSSRSWGSLVASIEPQDTIAFLPGAADRVFQVRWLGLLMAWIAACLSLEWLSRRIHRLA